MYYKHIIEFDLSENDEHWHRLMVLSDLRNAIAHSNGRVEAVRQETMKRIRGQGLVEEELGFIVVSETFLRETVAVVKGELEDLLKRYKEWKNNQENS